MPRRPSVGALPAATGDKRRANDGWLDRWVAAVSDLTRLTSTHPMMDAVIDEQVGRRIRIGDHWLSDFASCNYLGLDFDQDIIAAVPEYLARVGHPPVVVAAARQPQALRRDRRADDRAARL